MSNFPPCRAPYHFLTLVFRGALVSTKQSEESEIKAWCNLQNLIVLSNLNEYKARQTESNFGRKEGLRK